MIACYESNLWWYEINKILTFFSWILMKDQPNAASQINIDPIRVGHEQRYA